MNKKYITDFVEDLNYTGIILDIQGIDKVALKQRLAKDYVNKLYRLDDVSLIAIENCDIQDFRLEELESEYYDHQVTTLYQDENGYYIDAVAIEIFVFDFEVFRFDWIVDFKSVKYGTHYTIHNDKRDLENFIRRGKRLFCGFNCKHYDNFILKAILCGADNALVKEINDWIIVQKRQGFDHWFIKQNSLWVDTFDLKDDMQQGLSLKAIEGHLGMSIEETEVDFNLDRPLTEEELARTIKYNRHDTDATYELLKKRKPYLQNKLTLGRIKGLSDAKALYMTNAKLTAVYLGAQKVSFDDERDYHYPDNLLRQYIPKEVFDFFDQLHDPNISSLELFGGKDTKGKKIKGKELIFSIGECKCKIGFGGIHGAIPCYRETATEERTIRNKDVGSYYPHLVTIDGYCSRAMQDPKEYADMLERRMAAKKAGDKATNNALKLVCNTTYGAMLNAYNDLYDPRMGRSVCITGQLRLLELANHLVADCPTLKIIQLNTDGIMVSLDNSDVETYEKITEEWQRRTGFELEEDFIQKIIQKDVNNYIEIAANTGDMKIKGGYFVRGIAKAGAWNINNNATIVATAIIEYLAHDIPVEKTIEECQDIFAFQLIAKAGDKYSDAYHIVDGKRIPIQKVNRVYATADERYGKLSKAKITENDEESLQNIASLPEHCIIDNGNKLSIADVDKSFYVTLAKKRINDFFGIKEKQTKKKGKVSTMATKKISADEVVDALKEQMDKPVVGTSFLQKLFTLQSLMDEYAWEKDGKNMHQQYKYISEAQYKKNFKVARRKAGLLWECECVSHEFIPAISDKMHMIISDFVGRLTDPDTGEYREYHFSGSGADNGDKALYKAYTGGLKFFLADQYLVAEGNDPENDEYEDDTPAEPAPKKTDKKPKTAEERSEIKDELTDKNGKASKFQIDTLKKSLKKLREADPNQEDFIAAVAERTENFTNASKEQCEKLIVKVGQMIDEAGSEDSE